MTDFISQVLPGVGEMANIHPLLVHFPIALLNAFVAMELLGLLLAKKELRTAASWMLYLGTLGALAAVAAGLWAASTLPHNEEVHEIMARHRTYGLTVLSFAIILSLWRMIAGSAISKIGQFFQLLFGVIMVGTMTFGADLGGLMVYKYGVGTKAACPPQEPHPSGTADTGEGAFSSLEEHHHEAGMETPPCGEDPVSAEHIHAHHTH
ncbi:DUF2231 domain-containing protein [Methylocaldum sp. 14B]|uniref:DUF2231 domain-containing protein n=1 Tax=Methylocaldum sp. 14B TaxID=1912213 RepID=UPI00143B90A6|nr:DUF2231 domain-containing protein [Methylocaldum sp. 14B]